MKYIKVLGLAAVAALAMMASTGAGSASGTVLCKVYKTPCPVGQALPDKTVIDMTLKIGKSVAFLGPGKETVATCTTSTVKGKTTDEGGGENVPVQGNVEALTYETCSSGTIKVLKLGSFEVNYINSAENKTRAVLTSIGAEVTVVEVGSSCDFGTVSGATLGILESDEAVGPDLVEEATFPKEEGGFLCPQLIVVKGEYKITEPAEIFFKKATA